MSKQYEIEAEFFTTAGKPVFVFITYLVKSTGYQIANFDSYIPLWKNQEYSEFHSLICFDAEDSPYIPTQADAELWASTIKELILNHFIKKVA